MAYSPQLTTSIFNKLSCDVRCDEICFASPKRRDRGFVMWADLRRWGFRARLIETKYPADTCVSTVGLCNANFARS
jgi:hypothetical protein